MNLLATSNRTHRVIIFFDSDERSYQAVADHIWWLWTAGVINDEQADSLLEKLERIRGSR